MSPVSVFFQNYELTGEQRLLEDLTIEAIRIYGLDCHYVAWTTPNFDKVYGEDVNTRYDRSWMVECYLKNVLGFQGDREFMSKVAGLEIRDQVVFSMSRRVFTEEIAGDLDSVRPREDDLLYFPLVKKAFRIMYVNQYEMFYQLGAIYTWEMTCELFEYSSEEFSTGIPEIDALQTKFSLNILDYALKDTDGKYLLDTDGNYITLTSYDVERIAPVSDGDTLDTEANTYIDWTETDPFSDNTEYRI
jgi:hypothetical protein